MDTDRNQQSDGPHVLLINPWIDDFAAYDFWAKPLGLLMLGGILRAQGYRVSYIDCLDRFDGVGRSPGRTGTFGKGPYLKRPVPRPPGLSDVPRTYSRYGIEEMSFRERLATLPAPDLVLVTCLMTYWYPGALAVIRRVRQVFGDTPIFLGGVYATLCPDHARRYAGAHRVFSGDGVTSVLAAVGEVTGFSGMKACEPEDLDTYPYPCLDLQHHLSYVPVLTGRGCPYRCAYCASAFLNPGLARRSPGHVVEEILFWHERYGIRDVAFYDDALLIDAPDHLLPILDGLIRRGSPVRLHTPNALHIRPLTAEVARLLRRAGFKTIRLGLETAVFSGRETLDRKVAPTDFEQATKHLRDAGFGGDEVGAYLLCGLPGQDMADLEASIRIVRANGVRPILAQYSPIPHTDMWDAAVKASRYDLEADPIYQNNSIFPCQKTPFSWKTLSRLKALTQ